MAITPSDIPHLLHAGLRTEFDLAYRTAVDHSLVRRIATRIGTTRPVQRYPWLGFSPPMREFVDERRPTGLRSQSIQIEDKVFEATLAVERKAVEDDQLDLIRLRVREMASRVAMHQHEMLVHLLANGDTNLAYDGQAFFATRNFQGRTVSNMTTDSLSVASLRTGMSELMSVIDEDGVPLAPTPDTLLVGPSQYWQALELVQSASSQATGGSAAVDNPMRGRLRVEVSPFLAGEHASKWFLLDSSRPMRPLILQERNDVPVEFVALEASSGSESAFMRDRYFYGVRARYNVGLGMWQLAFGGGFA